MEFLNMWTEEEYSLTAQIDLKAKDTRMRISENYRNEQKITIAEITESENRNLNYQTNKKSERIMY